MVPKIKCSSSDGNTSSLVASEAAFRKQNPSYAKTAVLDRLRQTEYSRLDENGQIYLDYTGGGLYAQSQLDWHFRMLQENVFGNPHSNNPSSKAMTERVERARAFVLNYFKASRQEYVAIFTPNASGALKLVGEAYPFARNGHFLPTYDNHNSVNGIREFAEAKGATVTYIRTVPPDMRIDEEGMLAVLDQAHPEADNLFAYPAQSNFTGVQHSLKWIDIAQKKGWDVLLDAAAFVATNRLDLSPWKPDFVPISFYKMFGYPTGVGCLLARKSALKKLRRPWFAGGTITMVSVQGSGWHYLEEGVAAYEDGTVNYLSIPAVEMGLRLLDKIGIDTIHNRVACLTGWLLDQLISIHHSNGTPMVLLYGPRNNKDRGGTISFRLQDADGRLYDSRHIECLANKARISLRTGCFCNPGTGEIVFGMTRSAMAKAFCFGERVPQDELHHTVSRSLDEYPRAIRVSVGLASTFGDVYLLVQFLLASFLDQPVEGIKNTVDIDSNSTEHHLTKDHLPTPAVPRRRNDHNLFLRRFHLNDGRPLVDSDTSANSVLASRGNNSSNISDVYQTEEEADRFRSFGGRSA